MDAVATLTEDENLFSPWLKYDYTLEKGIATLTLTVDKKDYIVLLNQGIGSWVVLTKEEWKDILKNKSDTINWEFLYLRGISKRKDGKRTIFELPKPAEFPCVVILNVTTKCNLACKYCFANCGPKRGEDIKVEVIERTVKNIINTPYRNFVFEFQGGEPLLNPDAIEKCCKLALKLLPNGKKCIFRIETNGTIMNERIIKLTKKYKIVLGITLDGPKTLHDKTRVFPDGKGTFETIVKNIELLKKHNVKINGSVCNINSYNVKYPNEIFDFFRKLKINFKSRPINPMGRGNNKRLIPNTDDWIEMFKTFYELSRKYKKPEIFEVDIYSENVYTPIRDYVCLRFPCGACHEVVNINPNGDVYPCDGFKDTPEFKLGNILDENIESMFKTSLAQKLKGRDYNSIKKCKNCLFHSMCCSCIYSSYGYFKGDIFREDPYCKAKRAIFLFLIKQWIKENVIK